VLDVVLPKGGQNYRAFRVPWTGRPATKPTAAVRGHGVYVSWNGASEVRSWELHAGPAQSALQTVERLPRLGFETRFAQPAGAKVFAVTALDHAGRPLGQSNLVRR
jgi:hypothetical protein